MTHLTQTILKTPENEAAGIFGNCMQASIAIALGKPLDYVPHFGQFATWPAALTLWLRGEGLDYDVEPVIDGSIPMGRAMVVGDSPRGTRHAVASIDGVIYDPHPSRAGLSRITGAYVIRDRGTGPDGCWACGVDAEAVTVRARRRGAERGWDAACQVDHELHANEGCPENPYRDSLEQ